MAGLGGAEPGKSQRIQGGLGRGRELAEALRQVAVHVQECVGEQFARVEAGAVSGQDAAEQARVAARDEQADRGELVGAVTGHCGLEVQQPAQRPRTGGYHQMLAYHLGVQQHPLPPGHERHRFQETLDLAEPQVRELHRALALRGRRALCFSWWTATACSRTGLPLPGTSCWPAWHQPYLESPGTVAQLIRSAVTGGLHARYPDTT